MSYTMADIIGEALPRVTKAGAKSGVTIYGAANAILSLIYKHLVFRQSDLIASGNLAVTIPALAYYGTLPTDFVSPAERPTAEDIITNWMAGTVTSYNNTTGALVVAVTLSNGSDTLASWSVVTGAVPSSPPTVVGTSVTSLAVATGAKSLTTQAGLSASLTTGAYVIISSTENVSDLAGYEKRRLDPMNEDEHDDAWWRWYAEHCVDYDPICLRPSYYKVVGTVIYVRPRPAVTVKISGRYNAKPTRFTGPTDTIPWNDLFYEAFLEGTVRALLSGNQVPDEDQGLIAYIAREVDTVVFSRGRIMPQQRMKRSSYM